MGRLAENIRLIRQAVPAAARLMAVVKADAYGHGAVQTARTALSAGAAWLAVAAAAEGTQLRQAGITAPILILGNTTPDMALEAVSAGLTLTVCEPAGVRLAEAAAVAAGRTAEIHLKLDTGMGRIGARGPAEVRAVLEALASCPHVRLTGVFTHFAAADEDSAEAVAFTRLQLRRFAEWSALLPAGVLRHCANSAAILRLMPEAAFDMVRMGICMYGYPPVPTALPLQPLMDWTTEVTYVKRLPAGEPVSYGCTWTAPRDSVVATVACGYGDGYHRAASGRACVLIRGRRVPVIGRVCMDQLMADITDLEAEIGPGEPVTLMGVDGAERLTAEDLASWAGTISYEVLLSATGRVGRSWLDD